jgi:cell wall-associated NlpC family hydrolase
VVRYLGVRYDYGGSSAEGMDCSGFTCQVYKNGARKEIPRSTIEQYRSGRRVSKEELRFGDLVFFNTTGESPSHVGIYLEDDVFVHASVVEGVTLSSLESTYYKRRFVGARRVLD